MTITSHDQLARIREQETEGVMFPKGPHQMLCYIYAMEGVPAHEVSAHAKLIEMRDAGMVEPFSLFGVNLSGLTTLDRRGECAGLREQVERVLSPEEVDVIRAKFGNDDLPNTYDAVVSMIWGIHQHLAGGRRRAQRSRQYIGDLTWHVTCSPAGKEKCTVTKISERYGINQPLVSKDAVEVKRYLERIQHGALKKIVSNFSDGVVLSSKVLDERNGIGY